MKTLLVTAMLFSVPALAQEASDLYVTGNGFVHVEGVPVPGFWEPISEGDEDLAIGKRICASHMHYLNGASFCLGSDCVKAYDTDWQKSCHDIDLRWVNSSAYGRWDNIEEKLNDKQKNFVDRLAREDK